MMGWFIGLAILGFTAFIIGLALIDLHCYPDNSISVTIIICGVILMFVSLFGAIYINDMRCEEDFKKAIEQKNFSKSKTIITEISKISLSTQDGMFWINEDFCKVKDLSKFRIDQVVEITYVLNNHNSYYLIDIIDMEENNEDK